MLNNGNQRFGAYKGAVRTGRRRTAAIAALAILGACGGSARSLNDDEQIVRSVLTLLASKGSVCTDDKTEGQALAVFREMSLAPPPSREQLSWHPPTGLRPIEKLTTRDLRGSELSDKRLEIQEPDPRRDTLPGMTQMELDRAARYMSREIGVEEKPVVIRASWAPARVSARWWPINRVRQDCWPLFALSTPVRDKGRAFVTVRAEHWGTLYALKHTAKGWQIEAEWNRWLY